MHLRCCCAAAADVVFVVADLIARRFSVSRVYLLLFLPHLRLVRLAAVVVAFCFFFWTLSLNLHEYLRRHSNTHAYTNTHTHKQYAYIAFVFHLYFVTNWHCCVYVHFFVV